MNYLKAGMCKEVIKLSEQEHIKNQWLESSLMHITKGETSLNPFSFTLKEMPSDFNLDISLFNEKLKEVIKENGLEKDSKASVSYVNLKFGVVEYLRKYSVITTLMREYYPDVNLCCELIKFGKEITLDINVIYFTRKPKDGEMWASFNKFNKVKLIINRGHPKIGGKLKTIHPHCKQAVEKCITIY